MCPPSPLHRPVALELTWATLFLWQISMAEANCWEFGLWWELIVYAIFSLSPLVRNWKSMALTDFRPIPDTSFIVPWPRPTWLWTTGEIKHLFDRAGPAIVTYFGISFSGGNLEIITTSGIFYNQICPICLLQLPVHSSVFHAQSALSTDYKIIHSLAFTTSLFHTQERHPVFLTNRKTMLTF